MKTNRIHILMSDEELAAVDEWRFFHHIGSRGEAIRQLCAAATNRFDQQKNVAEKIAKVRAALDNGAPIRANTAT